MKSRFIILFVTLFVFFIIACHTSEPKPDSNDEDLLDHETTDDHIEKDDSETTEEKEVPDKESVPDDTEVLNDEDIDDEIDDDEITDDEITDDEHPECIEDEMKCEGTVLKWCKEGKWENVKDCDDEGKICDIINEIVQCVAPVIKCEEGEKKCSGTKIQECDENGVWIDTIDCADDGEICKKEDGDVFCLSTETCNENDTMCSDDTVLVCNDEGKWVNQEDCSDTDKVCQEEEGEAFCTEPPCIINSTKCGVRTEGGHEDYIVYKCNEDGEWVEEKDCLTSDPNNPQACKVTSGSAACVNTVCGDGTWHDLIEWCDPTDPFWQHVNSNPGSLACDDYWHPNSGIGGDGNIRCKSDCRTDLINCTPVGTPYGIIDLVSGTIAYTADYSRINDLDYIEHLDDNDGIVLFDPFFEGTVDHEPIPRESQTTGWNDGTWVWALRASTAGGGVIILSQEAFEHGPGEGDFNWLDQNIYLYFADNVPEGDHSVDLHSGIELELDVFDYNHETSSPCLRAIGFLGHISLSNISNLTQTDGGSFTIGGGPVYLHHPSDIPIFGDITDIAEEIWGVEACPL